MAGLTEDGLIEDRTIQPIPHDQRHGRTRDLFSLWFGINLTTLTIATGALCTTIFHLPLAAALFAIVFGNLFGAIFMALHAAQGPHLGVPQMVQTRGQFGVRGALAVIAFVALMDTGFFASNLALSAQSLRLALPGASPTATIVAVAAIGTAGAVFGHDLIHRLAHAMSWMCGLALLACFGWLLWHHPVPGDIPGATTTAGTLLGAISTSVLWQVAYAPYVSDYTRYLPADTGSRPAFWASFWGCALGSIAPMVLGALLGSLYPGRDIAESLAGGTGRFGVIAIPLLTLSLAAASAMSLYCAVLSVIAIGQTFLPHWQARARARSMVSLILAAIAMATAMFAGAHFMESYTNFLLLLLYVMVPWTAINLVDYYLVRHGDYDVASFLRSDGGIYGNYNGVALGCYAVGILVQVPFVSNGLYIGPVARYFGDADLSWIAGFVVVGPLYYAMARGRSV